MRHTLPFSAVCGYDKHSPIAATRHEKDVPAPMVNTRNMPSSPSRKAFRRVLRAWQLYLFLVPMVVYFLLFHYWPLYGIQIAFRDYTARAGIAGSQWVGLKHFSQFVSMVQFPILVKNTLRISILSLVLGFPLPILLALMLNEVRHARFKKLVQNITYAPHFVSTVVMVGMVIAFLSPSTGIISNLIQALGGPRTNLMTRAGALPWIFVLSGIWQGLGWGSILYLSALSGIDPTLYEAASIDGATKLQKMWHINIPGILPTIVITLIMNMGGLMSVGHEKMYLMQNDLNLETSEIISTYVYKVGLLNAKFSYSTAIGMFNSVINFILLLTVNAIARRISEISLW